MPTYISNISVYMDTEEDRNRVHDALSQLGETFVSEGLRVHLLTSENGDDEERLPCPAIVMKEGEPIPCTQIEQMMAGSKHHDGWAHSNKEHGLLWRGDE